MLRLFIFFGGMMIVLISNVYATPSFARQMGVSCNTCHSQNGFPALNLFGRQFKAGGFTMMGKQGVIEDPAKAYFLSLPETLNASFVAKIRAQDGDKTESLLEFPDEAALIIGGRVSEHIGTFIEIGYDADSNTFGLANFKLPVTYVLGKYTLGVVPYRTDGFGPSASFEVLNTGAVRNSRILEDRKTISAQQYIGTATEAEGLGLYLYNDLWNIVYSAWMPDNGTISDYTPAHYFRVAMTPTFESWDLGFGGQIWSGTAKSDDDENSLTPLLQQKTNAYALDFQALGNVNEVPLSFFATYAKAKHDAQSLYNTEVNDKSAATFLTEVGVIPSVLNLSAGYRIADNGKATNSSDDKMIIGIKYFFAENIELQLDYTHAADPTPTQDEDHVIFMLYGAF